MRPHRKPTEKGSSTPSSPPHPPERTKGGEHDPIISANGTIATKILHAAVASIQYTLHTKHNNGSRALDRTDRGHHSVHDGWIKMVDTGHEPTTRGLQCFATEGGRGSPVVDPLVRRTPDLTISGWPGTPNTQRDPPSLTPDTRNPNPNGSGFRSPPPRLSPHGNRVSCQVIRLPTLTRTQPIASHPGTVTDARASDSTMWRVRFRCRTG
jgi:hypothetical protein